MYKPQATHAAEKRVVIQDYMVIESGKSGTCKLSPPKPGVQNLCCYGDKKIPFTSRAALLNTFMRFCVPVITAVCLNMTYNQEMTPLEQLHYGFIS